MESVVELIRRAETSLPKDVESAIEKAYKREKDEIPRMQLKTILENVKIARKKKIPICQDTGLLGFFVRIGSNSDISAITIKRGIIKGVKIATEEIPLRPNTVHPITRKNSNDNTGILIPEIEFEFSDRDYTEITVMPKGAGSENMTRLGMLNPSEGIKGVKRFVIETVAEAKGNPCPPTIVGVGIGGSSDLAIKLAKRSLLREIGKKGKNGRIMRLENELLDEINRLGIGPMGLGGKTTSLAVNIEIAHCHTASLPVAVNLGCWANRRASVRIG